MTYSVSFVLILLNLQKLLLHERNNYLNAGMSDPEKAAELQKTISASPQSVNSDNAYWSGSSLPTQVVRSASMIYNTSHLLFKSWIKT